LKLEFFFVFVLSLGLGLCCKDKKKSGHPPGALKKDEKVSSNPRVWRARIKNTIEHNTEVFTQGLLIHQNKFYESSGNYGRSALRVMSYPQGKELAARGIESAYFAEGIAIWNDKIYQLTWREGRCLIYNLPDLERLPSLRYNGEGWGLATGPQSLIMSNGSATLYFRDPTSFAIIREIEARDQGRPVPNLNELEWVESEIWANVWLSKMIVRIDPRDGSVLGWVDLDPLYDYISSDEHVDVLNGIAYNPKEKRLFVTGKYWPLIFELDIHELFP